MREIKNEKDLADVFKSGELINEKAIEDRIEEMLEEMTKQISNTMEAN